MTRVQKNPRSGKIERIEMDREGLCQLLKIEEEELARWAPLFPEKNGLWILGAGKVGARQELATWKKRVQLLRTQMTPQAVANVEEAGLLDAYAALAEDCPQGLTAHVWRSYGAVVFMQVHENKKIGPHERALRARLERIARGGKLEPDVDMAAKHLRLLIAQGLLRDGGERWEHEGLPRFFQS